MRVASLGPFGDLAPFGKEAGFAGEDADLLKPDVRREASGGDLLEWNVRPRPRERRQSFLRFVNDLPATNRRTADVRTEGRTALTRLIQLKRDGQRIAAPLEEKVLRRRCLSHSAHIFFRCSKPLRKSASRTFAAGSNTTCRASFATVFSAAKSTFPVPGGI